MADDDECKINRLKFRLSQCIDAADRAQRALMSEQRRQGLAVTRELFTAADMRAANDLRREAARETIAATVEEMRILFDPRYPPDPLPTARDRAIDDWLCKMADFEERAEARAEAKAKASSEAAVVVPMKRRNET